MDPAQALTGADDSANTSEPDQPPASCSGTGPAVARGLLGGRDAAQRERRQCGGQGQQYRGQGERRGGGA
jgi:hypothetical protein